MTGYRAASLVAVLVLAVFAGSAPGGAVRGPGSTPASVVDCGTEVVHDDFRFHEATVNATANDTGTSNDLNTRVRVEQATGFVRVSAENPNGYCVRYVVELAPEVVSPASLGEIEATEGNQTATWRAVRDFNRSTTYTEVAFTLPAGSNATFAPSKARVAALKWTGTAKSASSGLLGDINFLGDDEDDLQQREYTFSPETNGTSIISVPLRDGNRTIDDYRAVYRVDGSGWRPVGTDSSAPVFKRELGNGEAVQFQFNDRDAEVKFTANPTTLEKAQHGWTSYWAGWDVLDSLFGGEDNGDDDGVLTMGPAVALKATEVR